VRWGPEIIIGNLDILIMVRMLQNYYRAYE
jgi:hypothetical protein